MKTTRLLDNTIEIIDRRFKDLIINTSNPDHATNLESLSYARKVDMLMTYLDNMENEIERESKNE